MKIYFREDVHVNGFGFLLLFILPGAYVDVPTEEIRALSPFRQLKVSVTKEYYPIHFCDNNSLCKFQL